MLDLKISCPDIKIARLQKKQRLLSIETVSFAYLFHYNSDSCLTNEGVKYHWVIVINANNIGYVTLHPKAYEV